MPFGKWLIALGLLLREKLSGWWKASKVVGLGHRSGKLRELAILNATEREKL